MSVIEEDTELRNLVAETLENKGILPRIRAELRAGVFLALDQNINARDTVLKNDELSAFVQKPAGVLVLNLVREFLEFFGLDFTLSVFDPETKYEHEYQGISKENMMKDLNIGECKEKGPLLYELISKLTTDCKDADAASASPNLNETYVKSKDDSSSTPLASPNLKAENEQKKKATNDVGKELFSENLSASDNSSNDNSKKTEPAESGAEVLKDNASDSSSFKQIPENSTEYDLLQFTPVKEVKTKEKHMTEKSDKGVNEKNKNATTSSVLGDLPPLNGKTEPKKKEMNEIKAIIEQGLNLENYDDDDFHSSASSKSSSDKNDGENGGKYNIHSSDQSQNVENVSDRSEKTDVIEENLDEDHSDLTNNQNTPESPITLEETISKTSDIADHLESL